MLAAEAKPGICNGPGEPITILVLGIDWRHPGYLYGLSDTVMVFRVDFRAREVRVMGFPRDMWVDIPHIEDDNGKTHGRLNQAYFYGTEGMGFYEGQGQGAGLLRETMELNWGLEIDHHLVVNMRVFRDVIDAVGGIEVYNPSHVYSFHNTKPKFPAGGYLLGGREALRYARTRDLTRNSLDRVDRQAIILRAMFDKLFDVSVIPKIPQLIGLYRGNVLTDLHLAQISQLLCLMMELEEETIQYHHIPKEMLYQPDWEGAVWLEKEQGSIRSYLEAFQSQEGINDQDEGDQQP